MDNTYNTADRQYTIRNLIIQKEGAILDRLNVADDPDAFKLRTDLLNELNILDQLNIDYPDGKGTMGVDEGAEYKWELINMAKGAKGELFDPRIEDNMEKLANMNSVEVLYHMGVDPDLLGLSRKDVHGIEERNIAERFTSNVGYQAQQAGTAIAGVARNAREAFDLMRSDAEEMFVEKRDEATDYIEGKVEKAYSKYKTKREKYKQGQ